MQDFFKRKLEIGDEVAFITYGGNEFHEGVVASFSPKQVRIEYPDRWIPNTPAYTSKQPHKIIKKNP